MKSTSMRWLAVGLIAIAGLCVAIPAMSAPVERLVFVSAGFDESNQFWTVGRPSHIQFDPYLETLLDLDPKTGEPIPRLAERWEANAELTEWTFYLRKGVQFHNGFGEMTAQDIVHSHALISGEDATATFTGFWRTVAEIKVVNDHQVVFVMKNPSSTIPYAASRSGDLRIVSKAQWDKEGREGFDKQPAGTGSYQYVSRKLGQSLSYKRAETHWSGQLPAFPELEIRLAREDATRLALILNGEAHVVDLPRELQEEALKKGMKIISSQLATDWLSVYFGGMFLMPNDDKFESKWAWTDKRVRQALNMAINRQELLDTIFKGKGGPMYVSGYQPYLEGWNPNWEKTFDQNYGYNPEKAKALLKEAGYAPNTLEMKILSYVSPGEAELPQVAEALSIYFGDIGIQAKIEDLDSATVSKMWRKKATSGYVWPNIIGFRPVEEWLRIANYSKGPIHHYENPFLDEKYLALRGTVDSKTRNQLAQTIGDYLYNEFADIPLAFLYNEMVANPKVVSEWTYPGTGAGRTTHFHTLKAAQ